MSYSNSSSAYDFAMFETRPVRRNEKSKQTKQVKETPAASAASAGKKMSAAKRRALAKQKAVLVLLSLVLVASVAMLIAAKTARTEVAHLLDSQQKQMDVLVEEHDAMMVEFERRMSDVAIEEYVMALGMQKRESLQTNWVSVPGGDVFEIAVDRSSMTPVESWCDNLLTYFG